MAKDLRNIEETRLSINYLTLQIKAFTTTRKQLKIHLQRLQKTR